MRPRPKSRWRNEDGSFNWQMVGKVPEYPATIAWDREFEAECDRLAEQDAIKTGKRHWGRWYLTNLALTTKTIRPRIDGDRGKPLYVGVYDIPLDRLDEHWVEHMKEKNWMGEKGLQDLATAIKMLNTTKK